MWLNEFSRRWLGWPTTGRPARPQAARRRGRRLTVEQLEDRCVPSTLAVTTKRPSGRSRNGEVAAVGVHVLPEEGDLHDAARGEPVDLREDVAEGP